MPPSARSSTSCFCSSSTSAGRYAMKNAQTIAEKRRRRVASGVRMARSTIRQAVCTGKGLRAKGKAFVSLARMRV